MIGLGRILAEAREARGTTLEEAERDTRIARRYLSALEEEDFATFPARVQARGFLRVYAQYLDLDVAEILALFPHDSLAEEVDALQGERIFRPARTRPSLSLPSVSPRQPAVVIAGALVATLLLAGLIGSVCASHGERETAGLAMLAQSGRAENIRVPDVLEDDLPTALAKMERAGIRPLVIEVTTDRVAAGLVISQSPPPNAAVTDPSDVTLIVSRGIR